MDQIFFLYWHKLDPKKAILRIYTRRFYAQAKGQNAMRIGIVGSGISGLSCAHFLGERHEITLFESEKKIGGHTATFDVRLDSNVYSIDTGFIVFNDRNYPNFVKLIDELGIPKKPTSMGFSVADSETGLEYSGTNLNTMFAQRRNIWSWSFLTMLKDIIRFNSQATNELKKNKLDPEESLLSYLEKNRYSKVFVEKYLVAMGSAIWSADWTNVLEFPAKFFITFFHNHGLLALRNRPQWYVIEGGSREYLAPLISRFKNNIRTDCRVVSIERSNPEKISVRLENGETCFFEQVILATHSDQALNLLKDPTELEQQILGAIPYQSNDVVLHTDTSLLPDNSKTWSSWNYRLKSKKDRATVTYNMNILQGISAPETFCVTLNDSKSIDPGKVLGNFEYHHPVFTSHACSAQENWDAINGVHNTWYCGAYWGNGFHEDGVSSALKIVKELT